MHRSRAYPGRRDPGWADAEDRRSGGWRLRVAPVGRLRHARHARPASAGGNRRPAHATLERMPCRKGIGSSCGTRARPHGRLSARPQKQKGGMAAQGKGIPEKQGARCTPIRLQPHAELRRICLGAGHETLLGGRHGKASPCVRRRTKPACRTPDHKEGVQQNPIKKNGLGCRKPMRHDIRPKGFSCEMKNAHQHYARKE